MRNGEYITGYGTIRNVNTAAIKQKRLKFIKNAIIGGSVLLMLISSSIGYQLGFRKASNELPGSIPAGYVMTYIEDEIDYGGNITATANNYYSPSLYGDIYGGINRYAQVIEENNGLYHDQTVHGGDTITLPVLVDEANPNYLAVLNLRSQIEEIRKTALWVEHVVQFGENPSSLAALASGGPGETVEIAEKILAHNQAVLGDAPFLREGVTIEIMNPELGPLKKALQEAEQALKDSLKQERAEIVAESDEKKPLS